MKHFWFIIIFCISGCKKENNNVVELLKSDQPSDLINAFYIIGESRDTSLLSQVILNPYDSRITHNMRFNGMSVYQSKMIALKKISKIEPPYNITYKPDSTIVNFYCEWIKENTKLRCK